VVTYTATGLATLISALVLHFSGDCFHPCSEVVANVQQLKLALLHLSVRFTQHSLDKFA
jgi:hypothetical protein